LRVTGQLNANSVINTVGNLITTSTGVGIGKIDPEHSLDVSGNASITGTVSANSFTGESIQLSGDINFLGNLYKDGELFSITPWDENGSNIFYSIGNVGIGTNSPQESLHVTDNIRSDETVIAPTFTGANLSVSDTISSKNLNTNNANILVGTIGNLNVNQNGKILGNLYVGEPNAGSTIYLGGGDIGDGNYEHSVIETRKYAGTELTEMLFFKGNDVSSTGGGVDRIRLRSGAIAFDTYPTSTTSRHSENIKMYINGGGNVGIATIVPGEKLDVVGNIRSSDTIIAPTFTGANLSVSNTTTTNLRVTEFANISGQLQASNYTNTIGNIITTSTGVGIGTSSPNYTLDVKGETNIDGSLILRAGTTSYQGNSDNSNVTNTYITFTDAGEYSDTAYLRQIGSTNQIMLSLDFHDDGSDAGFQIRDVKSLNDPDTITTRFIVNRGGNVGIATSNPSQKLDVIGNIRSSETVIASTFTGGNLYVSDTIKSSDLLVKNTASIGNIVSTGDISANNLNLTNSISAGNLYLSGNTINIKDFTISTDTFENLRIGDYKLISNNYNDLMILNTNITYDFVNTSNPQFVYGIPTSGNLFNFTQGNTETPNIYISNEDVILPGVRSIVVKTQSFIKLTLQADLKQDPALLLVTYYTSNEVPIYLKYININQGENIVELYIDEPLNDSSYTQLVFSGFPHYNSLELTKIEYSNDISEIKKDVYIPSDLNVDKKLQVSGGINDSTLYAHNGKVGINTTDPQYNTLDVIGNIRSSETVIASTFTGSNLSVSNTTTTNLLTTNATTTNLRVTEFANVSGQLQASNSTNTIGNIVTTSTGVGIATSNPQQKLDVDGNIRSSETVIASRFTGSNLSVSNATINNLRTTNATTTNLLTTNTTTTNLLTTNTTTTNLRTTNTTTTNLRTTNTTTTNLRTTNTSTINLLTTNATTTNLLTTNATTTNLRVTEFANISGQLHASNSTNTIGNIVTTSTGVGIGKIDPEHSLDVVGNIRSSDMIIASTFTGGSMYLNDTLYTDDAVLTGTLGVLYITGGSMDMSGDITTLQDVQCDTLRTNNLESVSDSRIKRDIQKLDDYYCMEKIKDIEVSSFKFIDKQEKHIGFIAQQIESGFPDVVNYRENTIPNINENCKIYKENDIVILYSENLQDKLTGNLVGKKLKLRKNEIESIISIKRIIQENTYEIHRTTPGETETGDYLLIGEIVNDFRHVDKSTIWTTAIGAIKYLYTELEKTKTELQNLRKL
jgi:uncharacterized protein YjbI with pentapeptide repeats